MGMTEALAAVMVSSTVATSYASSQATKSAADYNASISEQNRRLAEIQAKDAITRGEREVEKLQVQGKQLIARQRVAGAAQGQELEGPDSDLAKISADTAGFTALDVLDTRNNAWRESWGMKIQANQYSQAATMARLTGKSTARNTLLTGGMNVVKGLAQSYYDYQAKDDLASILSGYKATGK